MSEREGVPMVALEAIHVGTPLIIPEHLKAMRFLLGEQKHEFKDFRVFQNGIILKEHKRENLVNALNYLQHNNIEVKNKAVLSQFDIKYFESEFLKCD